MKILLLFLALILANISIAKTWKVSNAKGLVEGVKNATDGDTIIIEKGYYAVKNIEINKKLFIIGRNFPVLDAQFLGEIFTIKASGTQIKGIQFENVGETSAIDWAGVKVLEAQNVNIENNQFKNCYFGIYLSASSKITVAHNQIKGQPKEEQTTGNGIHAWKCDSILIANNQVEGHRDGIYFEFVTNSTIQYNHSLANIRYGLHFMFSHKNTYQYNIFEKNGAGVAVMYTKYVTMKSNIFKDNWGAAAYGILLKDISDSQIEQNQFLGNTVGIYMEGCSRTYFKRNEFSKNGVALRMQANCDENLITENNFLANTFDLATNGNTVFNKVSENYWDKYTGYDLNHDGTGDVAYRPVSLFSTLIERVPQVMMLVRSFTATLLDKIEKVIPSFTPENLKDSLPKMKPIDLKQPIITTNPVAIYLFDKMQNRNNLFTKTL